MHEMNMMALPLDHSCLSKGKQKGPGNYSLDSITSIPGKMMEQLV